MGDRFRWSRGIPGFIVSFEIVWLRDGPRGFEETRFRAALERPSCPQRLPVYCLLQWPSPRARARTVHLRPPRRASCRERCGSQIAEQSLNTKEARRRASPPSCFLTAGGRLSAVFLWRSRASLGLGRDVACRGPVLVSLGLLVLLEGEDGIQTPSVDAVRVVVRQRCSAPGVVGKWAL